MILISRSTLRSRPRATSSETDSVHAKLQAAEALRSASTASRKRFGGVGSILRSTRRVSVTSALKRASLSVVTVLCTYDSVRCSTFMPPAKSNIALVLAPVLARMTFGGVLPSHSEWWV